VRRKSSIDCRFRSVAKRLIVLALLTLGAAASFAGDAGLIPVAHGQSGGALEFADWSSVQGNLASGTLQGHLISLSGSHVGTPPQSRVDGTSTVFNQPYFSPPLVTSDAIELYGFQGYSYTLQFGGATQDPIVHIASLASKLVFPPGTQLTKVSGQSTFVVSGNTVTGALSGSTDANGTVRLSGTFTSASFSATPVFQAASEDGIDVQVGAPPPPPQGSPQPVAVPKTLADLPPPVVGKIVNVEPVKGRVLVALPVGASTAGSTGPIRMAQKGLRFVPLRDAIQIPTGAFLDTRRGTVRLQSARNQASRQTGDFVGGLFQVGQIGHGKQRGLTELRLKGSSFRGCASSGKSRLAVASRRRSRRMIRRLRGNAHGRFRTRGRYSSATVRGTQWTTIDRCDGTLTKVRRGKVVVRDFRRKRNVVVSSGKHYLARARR
jgi:hypothetical protein